MRHVRQPHWRSIRIPLREVDRVYGRDNCDNAGDDIADTLTALSDWPNQYRCRVSIDHTHVNPWYHALVFEVEGITDVAYSRFIEMIAELGFTQIER